MRVSYRDDAGGVVVAAEIHHEGADALAQGTSGVTFSQLEVCAASTDGGTVLGIIEYALNLVVLRLCTKK